MSSTPQAQYPTTNRTMMTYLPTYLPYLFTCLLFRYHPAFTKAISPFLHTVVHGAMYGIGRASWTYIPRSAVARWYISTPPSRKPQRPLLGAALSASIRDVCSLAPTAYSLPCRGRGVSLRAQSRSLHLNAPMSIAGGCASATHVMGTYEAEGLKWGGNVKKKKGGNARGWRLGA